MGNRTWRQRASRNRWGPYSWRVIRRHRWITEPPMCDPVLQPRPFTARSLVGMTMGARKRRSRAVSYLVIVDVTFIEHAETWANTDHSKLFRQRKFPRHQWDLEQYNQVRAKYRIGQKLRPCVGCLRCQCRSAFDAWPELGEELAKDHPTCDGSGVLPARRP